MPACTAPPQQADWQFTTKSCGLGPLGATEQWSASSNQCSDPSWLSVVLTAVQVSALSDDGVHWIAPSLHLQIRPQGTRIWLFRCSRNGENQWKGIGAAADKPLSEARDEAAMLRVAMRRGEDPFAQRDAARAATKPKMKVPSFADCAGRYIETHRAGWRNDKHAAQWESTIKSYANPVLGKLPVDRVTVEHVLKVLEPI
jgi:hypothetical protein